MQHEQGTLVHPDMVTREIVPLDSTGYPLHKATYQAWEL